MCIICFQSIVLFMSLISVVPCVDSCNRFNLRVGCIYVWVYDLELKVALPGFEWGVWLGGRMG